MAMESTQVQSESRTPSPSHLWTAEAMKVETGRVGAKSRTPSPSHFWANKVTKPRANNSRTPSPSHLWRGATIVQEEGAMPLSLEAALQEVAIATKRPSPRTPPLLVGAPPGLEAPATLMVDPMFPAEQDLYMSNLSNFPLGVPVSEPAYTPQRPSPRTPPMDMGVPPGLLAPPQDVRPLSGSTSAAASGSVPPPPEPFISVGSVNHPHACKEPCRYVKRKGGCRYGSSCPSCHLCFWRRPGAAEDVNEGESAISEGTKGHPFTCASACRYVRRRGGCRDGANCKSCHACFWKRDGKGDSADGDSKDEAAPATGVVMPTIGAGSAEPAIEPKLGECTKRLQGLLAELFLEQFPGSKEA